MASVEAALGLFQPCSEPEANFMLFGCSIPLCTALPMQPDFAHHRSGLTSGERREADCLCGKMEKVFEDYRAATETQFGSRFVTERGVPQRGKLINDRFGRIWRQAGGSRRWRNLSVFGMMETR